MSTPIIITADGRICTLAESRSDMLFDIIYGNGPDWPSTWPGTLTSLLREAPNLALNVSNSAASRTETWIWALIGCVLQLASLVFSGLATYHSNWAGSENPRLLGPRRATRYLTVAGSSLAFLWFVVQFIGLRRLHWSAAVVQLGVTLAMTVIRTIVRRVFRAKLLPFPFLRLITGRLRGLSPPSR
jgi:hypothetical protein